MDNTPPDTNTKSFSRSARMEDFFDETDVPNEKNNKNNKDNKNNEKIKKIKKNMVIKKE